jgi:Transposase IS116/IS110/IS902 family
MAIDVTTVVDTPKSAVESVTVEHPRPGGAWASQGTACIAFSRIIPYLGPVHTSILIVRVQVPNRFRTKRQFWAYCGLALETRNSLPKKPRRCPP